MPIGKPEAERSTDATITFFLRFKSQNRIDPRQYAQRVHACQPSDHLVQITFDERHHRREA